MKEHPVFARFYDWLNRAAKELEEEHRRELLSGLRGRVLELGSGPGPNFERYRGDVEVVAMEPEPNMMALAVPRAAEAAVPVRLVRAPGERLPFRDAAFDAVIVSLVLCSVRRPDVVAREIRRVLRPGGELRIFEHVRSENPAHARWQDRIEPIWGMFSAGCHPNRDTAATLRSAGFELEVRRIPVGPPTPARPHILGVAR